MATKGGIRDWAAGTKEVLVDLLRWGFEVVDFTAAIAAYLNNRRQTVADKARAAAPQPRVRPVWRVARKRHMINCGG